MKTASFLLLLTGLAPILPAAASELAPEPTDSFGVMAGMNQVLLGGTDQLHQSVIAMQEATTALSLMVQVRNKLVESYQELMRMQV